MFMGNFTLVYLLDKSKISLKLNFKKNSITSKCTSQSIYSSKSYLLNRVRVRVRKVILTKMVNLWARDFVMGGFSCSILLLTRR